MVLDAGDRDDDEFSFLGESFLVEEAGNELFF